VIPVTETPRSIAPSPERTTSSDTPDAATTVAWLEDEFPGWTVDIDETATWEGDLRSLWIARREGHHPQAELSPAKLHSRLSDYLAREERRRALSN
jgi:hypothetical protein